MELSLSLRGRCLLQEIKYGKSKTKNKIRRILAIKIVPFITEKQLSEGGKMDFV